MSDILYASKTDPVHVRVMTCTSLLDLPGPCARFFFVVAGGRRIVALLKIGHSPQSNLGEGKWWALVMQGKGVMGSGPLQQAEFCTRVASQIGAVARQFLVP
ncbi:hypothetical protein CLV88_102429 [Shimia abyssi]|uniref:Uncharacterized protein n=1 Tax=Shimia abyssi TaxID=1662395 RepID=A0A2P8FHU2_9RHOB|nr:hypothetical protein CLV88_102429 [Shimia abyssi]